MPNALLTVQDTFNTLDSQFRILFVACQTEEQRAALKQRYSEAQAAYQKCIGKMLSDDDAEVAALDAQIKAANQQIKQAVTEMGTISKVIDEITTAIQLGEKLVCGLTSMKP
jgi:archaellum component FlaF (FlaF/FlaG flagellin family)